MADIVEYKIIYDTSSVDKGTKNISKWINTTDKNIRSQTKSFKNAAKSTSVYTKNVTNAGKATTKLARGTKATKTTFDSLGNSVKATSVAMQALGAVSILGVVMALKRLSAGAEIAIDKHTEIVDMAKNVNAVLPQEKKNLEKVTEVLQELGETNAMVDFENIETSLYTLTSLYGDVDDAASVADKTLKASIATNTEAGDATKATATAVKVFGYNVEETNAFLDKYVATVNSGVLTGEKLSMQFGEAAIAVEALGGDANDALAVFGALGGALNEEQMKTALKGMSIEIQKDKEKFEALGISTTDFGQTLKDLEGRDISKIFASGEVIQFMSVLENNRETYNKLVEDLENSEGAVDETFKSFTDGAAKATYDVKQLERDFEVFVQKLGGQLLEIGGAFLEGVGTENIEEMFENVLMLVEQMVPAISAVAEIMGGSIADSSSKMRDDFEFIDETMQDINYLLGITADETEEASLSISDIISYLKIGGNLINPFYYAWQAIKIVIGTITDTMVGWKDLFTGQISLAEQLGGVFGGNILKNVNDVWLSIRGIKDDIMEIGKTSTFDAEGEFMTGKGGEIMNQEDLDFLTSGKTYKKKGIMPTIGGSGGDRKAEREAELIEDKAFADALRLYNADRERIDRDNWWANERALSDQYYEQEKARTDALAEEEKARAEAMMALASSIGMDISDGIVEGIRSDSVGEALSDVFYDYLGGVMERMLNELLLKKAFMTLIGAVSGGGGGGLLGGILGFADGGIVPATPGGTLGVISEAGYDEGIVPNKPSGFGVWQQIGKKFFGQQMPAMSSNTSSQTTYNPNINVGSPNVDVPIIIKGTDRFGFSVSRKVNKGNYGNSRVIT